MTDFFKIAKSIVVHFAHICAYGVETVNSYTVKMILKSDRCIKIKVLAEHLLQIVSFPEE